jgi:pimeloyl-ACP methyl ester carboxylesterase
LLWSNAICWDIVLQATKLLRPQAVTFCRTVDGINLAVAVAGDGPALVRTTHWLSHVEYDWLSPVTSKFLHSLADCSQLIRYDGRGVGLSDRNVPKLSFSTFQTDLETVVNSVKLERFALLGTSQGAAIAISYAARHPNRVSKLILHGAYALGPNRRGRRRHRRRESDDFNDAARLGRRAFRIHARLQHPFVPNGSLEQIKAYADLARIAKSPETATKIRMIQMS